jgi:CrcB protein
MAVEYLMVMIGGSVGAMSRYAISIQMKRILSTEYPMATFLINLSGSFLLGLLLGSQADSMIRLLLGTGFLGGYTTFSTFQIENVTLFRRKNYGTLLLYTALSTGLGIAFAWLGFCIAR